MEEIERPLVKICGITTVDDAEAALRCGADAIGLNFFQDSPRYVEPELAAKIARQVGDRALRVGLFVDADADRVREVLARVPLDIIQFHGSEEPAYCASFGKPYWKAIRVKESATTAGLRALVNGYRDAAAILLDAWHPERHGGTGEVFDWALLDTLSMGHQLVLAGGLNPGNVAAAVKRVKPWGVDVSSGVEATPGQKSETLMQQFIDEVKRV